MAFTWTKTTQFPANNGSSVEVTLNDKGVFLSLTDADNLEVCVEVTRLMAEWLSDVMMSDSVENRLRSK